MAAELPERGNVRDANPHALFVRLHVMQAQRRRQCVVHTGHGVVKVRVRGDQADAAAHEAADQPALRIVLPHVLPPAKQDRMVGDDQLRLLFNRLAEHAIVQIQRAEDALHRLVSATREHSGIVPLLLKRKGRKFIDPAIDLADGHRHASTSSQTAISRRSSAMFSASPPCCAPVKALRATRSRNAA